jgi:hypothetical protein
MLFVDMDGVIAAYSIGNNPFDFLNKRPLTENIAKIEEVSKISNVDVHILSICRENSQIADKNTWLDKNAPFFAKENRNIISRESKNGMPSKEIKLEFLKSVKTEKKVILIDDDNEVLKFIRDNLKNVTVMQDSELID